MPSISLSTLVNEADRLLKIDETPDYPGAHNGLQLENSTGKVTRIAAAVDAHAGVIEAAVDAKADLLIVHHGLFWSPPVPLTGPTFAKYKLAMGNNLAVYSAHLPLDAHPRIGNNALLAKALGLTKPTPFLDYKGVKFGMKFTVDLTRAALVKKLERVLGAPPHVMAHGPARVKCLGLCTGGGGTAVAEAAADGVDTYISGEGPQHTYGIARELGLNLMYGGHYATETFGVKALAARLAKKHGLPWAFLDLPTGL